MMHGFAALLLSATVAGGALLRGTKLSEADVEKLLAKVYADLGKGGSAEDGGFQVSDADDDKFTKMYGDMDAIKAETYGEVLLPGLAQLLSNPSIRHNSFVDLGSGLGRSVIFACLAEGYQACEGVELSKDRADTAKAALAEVEKVVPEAASHVHLSQGDLLASDTYFLADTIFANNLLFPDSVQKQMAERFAKLSPTGAVFICTKEIDIPESVAKKEKTSADVSWKKGGDFFFKYTKLG